MHGHGAGKAPETASFPLHGFHRSLLLVHVIVLMKFMFFPQSRLTSLSLDKKEIRSPSLDVELFFLARVGLGLPRNDPKSWVAIIVQR